MMKNDGFASFFPIKFSSIFLLLISVVDKTSSSHGHSSAASRSGSYGEDGWHNGRSSPAFKVLQNFEKGDVCRDGFGSEPEYVCTKSADCKYLAESIENNNYLDICQFEGKEPIVCCPTASDDRRVTPPKTSEKKRPTDDRIGRLKTAAEMCRLYNKMIFPKSDSIYIAVVGGTTAEPQEFPHMAALGYGLTTKDRDSFKCGGSLISEKWILTAAHCYKDSTGSVAKWARLGDLDLISTTDVARPEDYRIVQHVVHPKYRPREHYHDIALFRLNTEVNFSSFVRPICLNSDPTANPKQQIATGWGQTGSAESTSDELLRIVLDVFPVSKCNSVYSSIEEDKLQFGIQSESMICAGSVRDNEDTCQGDSGGPLQIKNEDDPDRLTQFGVTSFGRICGDKDTPAVYTRVSNYIKWIEEVVWPDN